MTSKYRIIFLFGLIFSLNYTISFCEKENLEKKYKALLNKWSVKKEVYNVIATITFETKELQSAYINWKFYNKSDEEKQNFYQEILNASKGTLCFFLDIKNEGAFNYLKIEDVSKNIVIKDNKGRKYYPVNYDKNLEEVFGGSVSGRIYFSEKILDKKPKWIKIKIYRLFYSQIQNQFKTDEDFEFYFILKKEKLENILW